MLIKHSKNQPKKKNLITILEFLLIKVHLLIHHIQLNNLNLESSLNKIKVFNL